ncbi:RimJ/RimL family protein N-acetyltransferase [Tamaricihabitans halophyticus]|uniref:RimJ/RimL family protein N-acetyltransferase n=1 Tax=Tamaricihabitans halophyticus TaxID=1262583 RepID=A0A4R2R2U8_9PSEU|nr:GNAT family protein [Tamaricihabitans halophyticus]TCP56134.1 RimJ/RimL family protein N-acetyltransferase [Tamaricihabitans halophyticus]
MISSDVFGNQPILTGPKVRLEPLGSQHFEGIWRMLADPEGARLTGTHQQFTEDGVRRWLATRQDHDDRADWAILRRDDNTVLGEVVLNELDEYNASVSFRISLVGPEVFGRGYGTEATQLVLDYAFDVAGLHRVHLEVYDFNPRAQRVYENCGFTREGVQREALHWNGQWQDAITMAILSTDPRPATAS